MELHSPPGDVGWGRDPRFAGNWHLQLLLQRICNEPTLGPTASQIREWDKSGFGALPVFPAYPSMMHKFLLGTAACPRAEMWPLS